MTRRIAVWVATLGILLFSPHLWAGGSGYNVLIVVNQNSTNSIQLGNYYRQMRNVPPQNYLRVNWPLGSNVNWSLASFTNILLNPITAYLASQKLTNQIDYIVLSMDLPYRVDGDSSGNNENGTTSALFYGFQVDTNPPCDLSSTSGNSYYGTECVFRQTPPIAGLSNSWLVAMITASNLSDAEMVVQQGAISDGTFPTNTVWLGKSSDVDRNLRFTEFDNTVFNTRLRGNYSVMRTNIDQPNFNSTIVGYQNGSYYFAPDPIPLAVPGGMADNLTSFGGQLFENSGETTLLKFVQAGISGSYGTVIEPCTYLEKFPNSQNYFYQSRGYSLGESYYMSVANPYQGLVVGEPLAAPFALPGTGAWNGIVSNSLLAGTTNLSVSFTARDASHPLHQLDLFVDGAWFKTITNIAPQASNKLTVTLNGFSTNYIVPTNASIKSVASNLVNALNGVAYENNSKVTAIDHGDRIELQSAAAATVMGSQISLSVSNSTSTGALTTFITPSSGNFLDTTAWGYTTYEIIGAPNLLSTLHIVVTKTNNATVTLGLTNTGLLNANDFTQAFMNLINSNAGLMGADGLVAEDLLNGGSMVQFHLRANSTGYPAAGISANITSDNLTIDPAGVDFLNDNLSDLVPRAHLYITAGVSNLSAAIPFATTNFMDGYHEIEAVAYEGSHVRTQTRATQTVIIQNTPLSATFTAALKGTNSTLQPTLNFTVTPNTPSISTIQLFSTGGLLAGATNQPSATFSVNYASLGIGVHPFYAIVTDSSGHQYRTQTQSIGLIGVSYSGSTLFGVDFPFTLQVSGKAPMFVWPATAGRTYTVLTATNVFGPFHAETTVTPTNSVGQFTETNSVGPQQFYRISVAP